MDGYMKIVGQTARQTVQRANNKKTDQNINDGILPPVEKINVKMDDVDEIVTATKKTAMGFAEASTFMVTRIIRPSSRYWPFLFPLMRLGLRVLKKKKEAKNVR